MEIKPPVPQIPPANWEEFKDLQEWKQLHKVRPETGGRADALSEAQASRLVPIFDGVLNAVAGEGRLRTPSVRVHRALRRD